MASTPVPHLAERLRLLAAWLTPGAPRDLRYPFGGHQFCREAAERLEQQAHDIAVSERKQVRRSLGDPAREWLAAEVIQDVASRYKLPEQAVAFTRELERLIAEVRP